jgi:hypothetical protein
MGHACVGYYVEIGLLNPLGFSTGSTRFRREPPVLGHEAGRLARVSVVQKSGGVVRQ